MSRSRVRHLLLAVVLVLAYAPDVTAQLGFSNLAEMRVGKDPDDPLPDVSESRFSRFDQFNLGYTQGALGLGLRHESYVPSGGDASLEFAEFTRRYAEWKSDELDVRLGNYEALFGRGLVLRAFELPGVVREEVGTPQFGDSRDLDGLLIRGHGNRWQLVVLQGKPRFADEPPATPRRGTVEGAEATVVITRGVRLGGEHVRIDAQDPGPGSRAEATGGFVQVGFDRWLRGWGLPSLSADTYVEYAAVHGLAVPLAVSSPNADPDRGYGLYWSQNVFLDEVVPGVRLGLSYEYKDYQNFQLGVNQPPTLVREHAYSLLNRTTHVLEPLQEEGYQLESYVQIRDWAHVTVNWSRAENRGSHRFRERYVEISTHPRGSTISLFAGTSEDGVEGILDRNTIGAYALHPLHGPHSLELEIEGQRVERSAGATNIEFEDRYVSLRYSWAGLFSLAYVRQTTDDPDEALDETGGTRFRREFDSLSGSVRIGSHHELTAFWGRRRGGLACTSGTCYRVRAFDGVSARLVSRF